MQVISDRDIEKFYKALELPINSSQAEVKAAYRSLARKYHPARFTGDPTKLKASEEYLKHINAAYKFLKTYQPGPQKTDIFASASNSKSSNSSSSTVGVETNHKPTSRTPKTLVEDAHYLRSIGNLQEALTALYTAIALQDDYYPAYYLRSEVIGWIWEILTAINRIDDRLNIFTWFTEAKVVRLIRRLNQN